MNLESFFNTSKEKRFHYPGAIWSTRNSGDKLIYLLRQNCDNGVVLVFYDSFLANSDYINTLKSEGSLHIRLVELDGVPIFENAAKHVDLFQKPKSIVLFPSVEVASLTLPKQLRLALSLVISVHSV